MMRGQVRHNLGVLAALALAGGAAALGDSPSAGARRPMTFLDVVGMRAVGEPAVSPDGQWLLYTLTVPDWKAAKSYSDVYLVSTEQGLPSTRQMTFSREKNETAPRWSRDGRAFLFLSDREAPASAAAQRQLYRMRPDGGEAQRLTDAKEGVAAYETSRDGKWIGFTTGKTDEQQVWLLDASAPEPKPAQLTRHATGVTWWTFAPDSRRVYFLAPEALDADDKARREQKFDVRIRNQDRPLAHLWALDLETKQESRLTGGAEYSVSDVVVSRDGKWIGFRGTAADRYARTIVESGNFSDLYLLEVATGAIERLTTNAEIAESDLSFSPDGTRAAFSAPDGFAYFRNSRVYLRPVAQRGGEWTKLGRDFDGDVTVGFWSDDGRTIYFNEGIRAAQQLCALSTETGRVTPLTREMGMVLAARDEDSRRLVVRYSDPVTPWNLFTTDSLDKIGSRGSWARLTDSNPQVAGIALGETEVVRWKSADGRPVEGVLVKPVGYEPGKRYPLIVQIHGGPASASMLTFEGGHSNYSHVYAGAGYACLLPNYRGSANYGERHKTEIARDYFRRGYEDIMTGVDHLVARGLADPDRLGVMGWSAGGHWSNWILTHTDRFKAISSGAGAVNWISMYAQTDVQRNREFYFGGTPYERFEHYWDVSPLKYIKNARTPTLIHVVDGDPRVPRPQSEELHMALRKLGVPTELLVYPGSTHGITDPRNRMVKMAAEFHWFEKWVRGKPGWFRWRDLLDTLEEKPASKLGEAARE